MSLLGEVIADMAANSAMAAVARVCEPVSNDGFSVDGESSDVRVLARFVLKYTLRAAHLQLGGVNLDLAVEDDVLPFDRAYMSKQVPVEGKIRRGGHSRDLLGLPIDDAGENQGQTGTGFHLIMDFASADTASLSVIDGACEGMELFDLQQTSADPGPQLRGNLPRTRTKAIWYANPSRLRRPRRRAISRKSASRKLASRIRRGRETLASEAGKVLSKGNARLFWTLRVDLRYLEF